MEHFALNHSLHSLLYVGAQPASWQLMFGTIAAKYLIYFYPLFLLYQFIRHKQQRPLVIVVGLAMIIGVVLNTVFGHLWLTNRPFVDGLAENYLHHIPDSSFVSDHTLVAATVAWCYLIQAQRLYGSILLLGALIIGLSRVYMGVHYPFDIFGGLLLSGIIALVAMKWIYPTLVRLMQRRQ